MFQSTRPRRARPAFWLWKASEDVSIHAPAKGATETRGKGIAFFSVSIHAPAKGATADPAVIMRRGKFQSTRPRRARLNKNGAALAYGVSIHAPAKGATREAQGHFKSKQVSIHAPAKGATVCIGASGGRHPVSIHAPAKGATKGILKSDPVKRVSIHAPAKGATDIILGVDDVGIVSIHAPAKGATPGCPLQRLECARFNPRAREGRDLPDMRGG